MAFWRRSGTMVSTMKKSWRSAKATRIMLVAALASTTALSTYNIVDSRQGGSTSTVADGAGNSANGSDVELAAATFTTADAGSCLTWQEDGNGISGFEQTSCEGEHRFEVAAREDLSAYPSSEFGENATMPDLTRQAQLREELCLSPTLSYLGGTFDQLGKYSVASILPPQEFWEQGDRTLLCGIQATDEQGNVISTTGTASSQDQSRVTQVGDCVAIDASSTTRVVDCSEPHQLETTQVVDLLPVFPEGTPSIEDQDNHLRRVCTQAAQEYLGGDDPLYYSTLQPFWSTITANSWTGGSHSVNCSLVFANPDASFGTLEGSAKEQFTINGNPPAARPERSPIVNPDALAQVDGQAPAPAEPAPGPNAGNPANAGNAVTPGQ